LRAELLTRDVIDPCCGPGLITLIARTHGYKVVSTDLHDWGFGRTGIDFLTGKYPVSLVGKTVLMNPPFSLACQFVDRARILGARKIISFQRLAWKESDERRAWWEANRPQREYVCGKRAHCFYPIFSKKYRKGRRNTMAMAWYVWEQGQPAGPISSMIYPHPDFQEAA
jgi:predicted RNA methylase